MGKPMVDDRRQRLADPRVRIRRTSTWRCHFRKRQGRILHQWHAPIGGFAKFKAHFGGLVPAELCGHRGGLLKCVLALAPMSRQCRSAHGRPRSGVLESCRHPVEESGRPLVTSPVGQAEYAPLSPPRLALGCKAGGHTRHMPTTMQGRGSGASRDHQIVRGR
jgi:hypothetical protein